MPDIVAGAGYATFINTFRCAPEDQETVVQLNVDTPSVWPASFPDSSRPPCTAAWTAPA